VFGSATLQQMDRSDDKEINSWQQYEQMRKGILSSVFSKSTSNQYGET
jgi:hypothetical protein